MSILRMLVITVSLTLYISSVINVGVTKPLHVILIVFHCYTAVHVLSPAVIAKLSFISFQQAFKGCKQTFEA